MEGWDSGRNRRWPCGAGAGRGAQLSFDSPPFFQSV